MKNRRISLLALTLALALPAVATRAAEPLEANPSWLATVEERIADEEYEVTWQDSTVLSDLEAAWHAPNRAHGLRTYYTEQGVRVVPREMDSDEAPAWEWSLSLVGYGAGGQSWAVPPAELSAEGNRIEYLREGLTEWYVNQPRGLKQGFTLPAPPEEFASGNRAGVLDVSDTPGRGRDVVAEDLIHLDLELTGGLTPQISADGRAIDFTTASGAPALRYDELVVTDATGRELPSWMEAMADEPVRGIRIVIDAHDAVFPVTVDPLLGSPAWTAESNQASAFFGFSVATAGDVNGDGYDDMIVGSNNYDNGQNNEGRAWVFLGSASGPAAAAAWTAESDQIGALFGESVATAGDVNDDGYADVIVGALGYTNGESSEGRAFVYLGSGSGLAAAAAWTAESNQDSANFGWSVATAGDVNDDGYADVIVGAQAYDNGQTDEGQAFVYLGSGSGLAAGAAWTAQSNQASAQFGYSVATAGDVNDDGYSDVIVGAQNYDNGESNEGRAFVYLGSGSGLAAGAAWTAESNQASAFFGLSVATAGDVNDDGYSDVIVGAPSYDNGQTDEGRAFVYLGSSSGLAAAAAWIAESNTTVAQLGRSVGTAGDVNGDGYSDVIVGAQGYANGQTDEGRAFVYLGSSSGLAAGAAWTAESNQAGAWFGWRVATAGDVNGDGYSDVIVGSHLYDNGQTDEGRAWVYYGSAVGLGTTAASWTAVAGGEFGFSVATAGDVNDDGYADVIVGARTYDNGQAGEGRAFVYLGSASGLAATTAWTAESNQAGANYGGSVSTAGDVNGDGYSDVIVGAINYSNGQASEGRAFVYLGSGSGLAAAAAWTAESDQISAQFGCSVATAGDVNDDGFDDVIVGDYFYSSQGRAFVYLGSGSGLAAAAAWTAQSGQASAQYGWSVATAGDVNGDGYSDVIVGATGYDNGHDAEGRAFVYLGSASGPSTTPAWTAEGNQTLALFGFSVSTAGDVNDDGYSDVIVGSERSSSGQTNEGRAFVYLGSASGLGAAAAWIGESNQTSAFFGTSVATAGDVNGDGYSDVIVGAPQYDNVESNEGRAFVYLGSASGLGIAAAWTAETDQAGAFFGASVATAGDVNGDGAADVIVGAYVAGRAYVYYGNGIDTDDDGLLDGADNCKNVPNVDQTDTDSDGDGDACDNCLTLPNADQANFDNDPLRGDFCQFVVGEPIAPPAGAYSGSNMQAPAVNLGTTPDTLHHIWSPPTANGGASGRLFVLTSAPQTATLDVEVLWEKQGACSISGTPCSANTAAQQCTQGGETCVCNAPLPCGPGDTIKQSGRAYWPLDACQPGNSNPGLCVQHHVKNAPVKIVISSNCVSNVCTATGEACPGGLPDECARTYVPHGANGVWVPSALESPSDASIAGVSVFNAGVPGYSLIQYTRGPSADASQYPLEFRIVRTLDWQDPLVNTGGPQACTIGSAIEDPVLHDEPGRPGYVLFANAFYDGAVSNPAYDRGARTGTILPVNRVNPLRAQDTNKTMAVAWYREGQAGLYWPTQARAYDCQWPASPDKIVIASEEGGENLGQVPLNPTLFDQQVIYHQASVGLPGYNPNDEHALFRASNIGNNYPAIYALRNDFGSDIAETTAASDPYVLVKYCAPGSPAGQCGPDDDAWQMRVYEVVATTSPEHPEFLLERTVGEPVEPLVPMGDLGLFQDCRSAATVRYELPGDPLPPIPFFRDWKDVLWASAGRSDCTNGVPSTCPPAEGEVHWSYKMQADFFIDVDNNDVGDPATPTGSCLPLLRRLPALDGDSNPATAAETRYEVRWPDTAAVLTVGETLLQPKRGLPAISTQAAVQVIYDQYRRETQAPASGGPGVYHPKRSLVRLIRPLDERRVHLTLGQFNAAGLATEGVTEKIVIGSLDGSRRLGPAMRARLSYDSLSEELVLTGLFDEAGAGEPLLIPNVLTERERLQLAKLDDDTDSAGPSPNCAMPNVCDWDEAIQALFELSRNPHNLALYHPGNCPVDVGDAITGAAVTGRDPIVAANCGGSQTWAPSPADGPVIGFLDVNADGVTDLPSVLGTDSALTAGFAQGTGFVVLAFNNDISIVEPVSLEVIRVDCITEDTRDYPYQGQIQVIQPDNLFDEAVTLRHSGDFAGSADNLEFEWFIQADADGTPPAVPLPSDLDTGDVVTAPELNGWTKIVDNTAGASEITIGGTEIQLSAVESLADNWFLARYRGLPVCGNETRWALYAGQPGGTPDDPRAQLSTGWVKRVLARLNPVEEVVQNWRTQQISTIANAISRLGGPYEGPIALNAAEIGSAGLIEAYETVLRRARVLSAGENNAAANNAILLVSTRLSEFYAMLGNEAHVDALDPTIGFDTASAEFGTRASSIFAFKDRLDSLLEEEQILLRGEDATVATPFYNRLLPNFGIGTDGQIAYVQAYNIEADLADPVNTITAADAQVLYPQGHGDAWGHYLSALRKHYDLLADPNFKWIPRPEAVVVAGVPVQVDFQDERKFARVAAARSAVGAEIVDLTYRQEYVEDVEGQWQGYKDTAIDPTTGKPRAWGVDGWARRAGMSAYLDWLTGNTILPAEDPEGCVCENPGECIGDVPGCHEGIQEIERGKVEELSEIASNYRAIQTQLDEADTGLNPLGLAKGVVPFDISPADLNNGTTHFEQVYERATVALEAAVTTWDFANDLTRMLRQNEDSLGDFADTVEDGEYDFKARLLEIFGRPYPADIGPGQTYPAAYDGPDLYHYQYIDVAEFAGKQLNDFDPGLAGCDGAGPGQGCQFEASYAPLPNGLGFFAEVGENCGINPFGDGCTLGAPPAAVKTVKYAVWNSPEFGPTPVKPPDWTVPRPVTGEIQAAQQEIALAQLALKRSIREYSNLFTELEGLRTDFEDYFDITSNQLDIVNNARNLTSSYAATIQSIEAALLTANAASELASELSQSSSTCPPTVVGLATDATSAIRCGIKIAGAVAKGISRFTEVGLETAVAAVGGLQEDVSVLSEIQLQVTEAQIELSSIAGEFDALLRQEPILRAEILERSQILQQAHEAHRNALARGETLLDELVRFRKKTAAEVQDYRYQDLAFRLFRIDALQKYRAAFDLAAKYTYLATTAYDYETNLLGTDTQGGEDFLRDIVRERSLGEVSGGVPQSGSGGLAEPLSTLAANFSSVSTQLGFNNPQYELNTFGLRFHKFLIPEDVTGDIEWAELLEQSRVDDLCALPKVRRFAKLPPDGCDNPQPGFVIPFSSTVTDGLNFFGNVFGPTYTPTNDATRIRATGVWLDNYAGLGLSSTPMAYLLPVGADVLRVPGGLTRQWDVVDQALPLPSNPTLAALESATYIPVLDTLDTPFGAIRRMPEFQADDVTELTDPQDPSQYETDTRLIGRSVWNTEWLLVIRGKTLPDTGGNVDQAMQTFISGVKDIRILFSTYAYSGQ